MSITQEAVLKFIKTRGGVVPLSEISHFNPRDIEFLKQQNCINVYKSSTGFEVELLKESFSFSNQKSFIPDPVVTPKATSVPTKKRTTRTIKEILGKRPVFRGDSAKKKIFDTIKNAENPLDTEDLKRLLPDCNTGTISAYLSVLKKEGAIICNKKTMNRHYTIPGREESLKATELPSPRQPRKKPKPIPVPVPATNSNRTSDKYAVWCVVTQSSKPLTLLEVRSLVPHVQPSSVAAYLSRLTYMRMLTRTSCHSNGVSRVTYHATDEQKSIPYNWRSKERQKTTSKTLELLRNSSKPLSIKEISLGVGTESKGVWFVIRKLQKRGLVEVQTKGYSKYIVLASNDVAKSNFDTVSGHSIEDQVIDVIKKGFCYADEITPRIAEEYSVNHVRRVLKDLSEKCVLNRRVTGRRIKYSIPVSSN